jgi:hypothetical protein
VVGERGNKNSIFFTGIDRKFLPLWR